MLESIYRIIGRTADGAENKPLQQNGVILNAEDSAILLAETFYSGGRANEDSEEQT